MFTWWRRARFSSSNAARERIRDRKTANKLNKTDIEAATSEAANFHHLKWIDFSGRDKSTAPARPANTSPHPCRHTAASHKM
jgi:hypothetical protein